MPSLTMPPNVTFIDNDRRAQLGPGGEHSRVAPCVAPYGCCVPPPLICVYHDVVDVRRRSANNQRQQEEERHTLERCRRHVSRKRVVG